MRRAGKVFDYDQDDGYIFAAFLEQYGVDLEQAQTLVIRFDPSEIVSVTGILINSLS